jgi:hypothetical protein
MDLNALKGYMDFYNQNFGYPTYGPTQFGGAEDAMNMANQRGAALQFALRMAGQNGGSLGSHTMPNYFAAFQSSPNPAVTIGDNPYTAMVNKALSTPGVQVQPATINTNFLARYIK